MYQVICIGSGSKDIFFPTSEMKLIENLGDVTAKVLMAFEYGAKYQIEDRYEAPGGCAANSAQALARLGIRTACYCRVGEDQEGKWVIENLAGENVGTEMIQVDEKFKTDLSFILVNETDGERTIFFNRDANEKLEIFENEIDSSWVFVSALNGDWEEHLGIIQKVCENRGIFVAYNPGQSNIKHSREAVLEFLKAVKILMVNRDEAVEIVGKDNDDYIFLLDELKKLGPKIVVLTDGRNGSFVFDGRKKISAPAILGKPVDLTGAGDAFSGAFLAAYIRGMNIEDCLRWGTANGGNVVNFYGAKEGLLNEIQMAEYIKSIEVREIQ